MKKHIPSRTLQPCGPEDRDMMMHIAELLRNTSIDAIDKDLLILLEKEPKVHIPCATILT